jgi:hypothetical protein
MPENPHIQAQLAVVLRDLVRNGESEFQKRLKQTIATTLKLDENNIEALTLYSELLVLEGEQIQADKVLEKIQRIDLNRGTSAIKASLITRIERHLDADELFDATDLIHRLAEVSRDEASRLLQAYIKPYEGDMPLLLVDSEKAERWDRIRTRIAVWGILLGVAGSYFANSTIANSATSANIQVLLVLGLPCLFYFGIKYAIARSLKRSAIVILQGDVFSPDADYQVLLVMAEALDEYEDGNLDDLLA